MSEQNADYERAHERQELASRLTRERAARLHLWLQGGPVEPTGEDLEWARTWFPDLFALTKVRFANGSIPPSSEYHMERARRFIAGDLGALIDGEVTP
jgi:hypothetical protein